MVQTTERTLKTLGTTDEGTKQSTGIGYSVPVGKCLFLLKSSCLVTSNLTGSRLALFKAEAKLGRVVDEQWDHLILMSKFSQHGAFSGLETERMSSEARTC